MDTLRATCKPTLLHTYEGTHTTVTEAESMSLRTPDGTCWSIFVDASDPSAIRLIPQTDTREMDIKISRHDGISLRAASR